MQRAASEGRGLRGKMEWHNRSAKMVAAGLEKRLPRTVAVRTSSGDGLSNVHVSLPPSFRQTIREGHAENPDEFLVTFKKSDGGRNNIGAISWVTHNYPPGYEVPTQESPGYPYSHFANLTHDHRTGKAYFNLAVFDETGRELGKTWEKIGIKPPAYKRHLLVPGAYPVHRRVYNRLVRLVAEAMKTHAHD